MTNLNKHRSFHRYSARTKSQHWLIPCFGNENKTSSNFIDMRNEFQQIFTIFFPNLCFQGLMLKLVGLCFFSVLDYTGFNSISSAISKWLHFGVQGLLLILLNAWAITKQNQVQLNAWCDTYDQPKDKNCHFPCWWYCLLLDEKEITINFSIFENMLKTTNSTFNSETSYLNHEVKVKRTWFWLGEKKYDQLQIVSWIKWSHQLKIKYPAIKVPLLSLVPFSCFQIGCKKKLLL